MINADNTVKNVTKGITEAVWDKFEATAIGKVAKIPKNTTAKLKVSLGIAFKRYLDKSFRKTFCIKDIAV